MKTSYLSLILRTGLGNVRQRIWVVCRTSSGFCWRPICIFHILHLLSYNLGGLMMALHSGDELCIYYTHWILLILICNNVKKDMLFLFCDFARILSQNPLNISAISAVDQKDQTCSVVCREVLKDTQEVKSLPNAKSKEVRCRRTRCFELGIWYVWVVKAAVPLDERAARTQYLATLLFSVRLQAAPRCMLTGEKPFHLNVDNQQGPWWMLMRGL